MSVPSRNVNRGAPSPSAAGEAQWPPSWNIQPHGISVGRYIDPAFMRLEYERLWSRAWQVAARLDEIPEAGDYTTYEIGDQSVVVVRVDESTIKAYHNVCPHRGTALAQGSGRFASCRIMCPFHGWRWDLNGNNQFILERQEFRGGQLRDSDVALRAVQVALFAGFVFINFDPDCRPFDAFIAPVRAVIEGLAIGDMHHYWWKSIAVPANWKVAQEAFFEAFHVPATHPQLEKTGAEVIVGKREDAEFTHRNVLYEVFPHGHGRFYGGKKTPMAGHVNDRKGDPLEEMAARLMLLVDGMDAMVLKEDVEILRTLRGKPIPEGSSLGGEYVKALYATAAAQQRPMPKLVPEILNMWGGEVFVFPNLMILPQAGNAMIYRVRPNRSDPDSCTFEILSTRTLPAAVKPPRPRVEHVTDVNDPEQILLIPRQDLGNIPRIQKGLHSRGIQHTWLAVNQEKLIVNMHEELDRYLSMPPGAGA
jgi:phenylpropionate dioxygenase-like ring-hydroxylating dioxygenase large terminal subunit